MHKAKGLEGFRKMLAKKFGSPVKAWAKLTGSIDAKVGWDEFCPAMTKAVASSRTCPQDCITIE